jgi:hypothetical protein
MKITKDYARFLVLVACIWALGCAEDTRAIGYRGVNHTEEGIVAVVLNDGGGVLDVPPMGGGGAEACCISLPRKWRPGLTVKVDWQMGGKWLLDDKGQPVIKKDRKVLVEGAWKTRTVEIPAYDRDKVSHLAVHFFPNDEVKVLVSWIYPSHPDYPIPYPRRAENPSP